MKKSIYFFVTILISLSLMAFVIVNWSDVTSKEVPDNEFAIKETLFAKFVKPELEFTYAVDSRYAASITKNDLQKAKTVVDLVPIESEWSKIAFLNMKIVIFQDDQEIAALGEDEVLNTQQLDLLHSLDYSSNFYINARGKDKPEGGPEGLKDYPHDEYDLAYYLTVIPEKEAMYEGGMEALIDYLKVNSKEQIAIVQEDQLKSGMVSFIITKEGIISDINLLSTSGYASIDDHMLQLIQDMPGKWTSAENTKGDKVDQALIFSFGQVGC